MSARTYKARGINGHESFRWEAPQSPIVAVQPGDIVRLDWWGDSGVPMWCNRREAVVLRCNPKRIVVHPFQSVEGFVLTVLPERHVSGVRRVEEGS